MTNNDGAAYFKSLLCLNGHLPHQAFFEKFSGLPLVAADGAGSALLRRGVCPRFIVGDMDSFHTHLSLPTHVDFIEVRNQNLTDFEKSILYMREKDLFPALVCGVFGKEVDHMLNNINCLMRYARVCPMVFYAGEMLEKPHWGFPISGFLSFVGIKDEIISILPHPTATLSTQGFKWDLDHQPLSIFGMSSCRNQVQSYQVAIHVHAGSALLIAGRYLQFYDRSFPPSLE